MTYYMVSLHICQYHHVHYCYKNLLYLVINNTMHRHTHQYHDDRVKNYMHNLRCKTIHEKFNLIQQLYYQYLRVNDLLSKAYQSGPEIQKVLGQIQETRSSNHKQVKTLKQVIFKKKSSVLENKMGKVSIDRKNSSKTIDTTKPVKQQYYGKQQQKSIKGTTVTSVTFTSQSITSDSIINKMTQTNQIQQFYQKQLSLLKCQISQLQKTNKELQQQNRLSNQHNKALQQKLTSIKNKLQAQLTLIGALKSDRDYIKACLLKMGQIEWFQYQQQISNKFQEVIETVVRHYGQMVDKIKQENQKAIQLLISNLKDKISCVGQSKQRQKQKDINDQKYKQIVQLVVNKINVLSQNKVKQCLQQILIRIQSLQIENKNKTKIQKSMQSSDQIQNLGENKLKQHLIAKYIQLKKQADKKKTCQQQIRQNPALCFQNSSILPIFPSKSQPVSSQVQDIQQWILESITNFYKKSHKIQNLQLLYSFQTMQQGKSNNFHNFIDNTQNLLMLIKLINGVIIGVYSQSGISKSSQLKNKNVGFLFQTKNRKVFYPRQKYNKKSAEIMGYDQYYIIVGNYDIKIKMGELLLESCFGSQSSLFRPTQEYTYDSLLFAGPEDSVKMENYEFFKIYFC